MSLFFVEKDAAPIPISCWILRLFASRFQSHALPRFIVFTNSDLWFIEEGGEELASEIKRMILGLIGSIHVVDLRRQNDLSQIIV